MRLLYLHIFCLWLAWVRLLANVCIPVWCFVWIYMCVACVHKCKHMEYNDFNVSTPCVCVCIRYYIYCIFMHIFLSQIWDIVEPIYYINISAYAYCRAHASLVYIWSILHMMYFVKIREKVKDGGFEGQCPQQNGKKGSKCVFISIWEHTCV